MKETDLYEPIVAGILHDGLPAYKIVDGSAGKKPFDIAGINSGGQAFAIEVKLLGPSQAEAESLDWGLLESHQAVWLKMYARMHGVAVVAVYCQQTKALLIWRLTGYLDFCYRPPDFRLVRSGDMFRGWLPVLYLR